MRPRPAPRSIRNSIPRRDTPARLPASRATRPTPRISPSVSSGSPKARSRQRSRRHRRLDLEKQAVDAEVEDDPGERHRFGESPADAHPHRELRHSTLGHRDELLEARVPADRIDGVRDDGVGAGFEERLLSLFGEGALDGGYRRRPRVHVLAELPDQLRRIGACVGHRDDHHLGTVLLDLLVGCLDVAHPDALDAWSPQDRVTQLRCRIVLCDDDNSRHLTVAAAAMWRPRLSRPDPFQAASL